MKKNYPHGGGTPDFPCRFDVSANVNPFGPPDEVVTAVKNAAAGIGSYPDAHCRALRAKAAEVFGVPAENLLFGNGAAELIYAFAHTLPRGSRALTVEPTFCEYRTACAAAGVVTDGFKLDASNGFEPGAKIAYAAGKGYSAVFMCTPNNPTGVLASPETVSSVAAVGVPFLCDLSFIGLCRDPDIYDLPAMVRKYPNAVFLRSFTKSFAMPGIRLGCAICGDETLLERMSEQTQCWNVSSVAQEAGIAALGRVDHVIRCAETLNAERERLARVISETGVKVFRSDANFLLCRHDHPVAELLAAKGIKVRDCSNFFGLDGSYFRVAVRNRFENDELAKALKEVLK